jgi:hypothetical protein
MNQLINFICTLINLKNCLSAYFNIPTESSHFRDVNWLHSTLIMWYCHVIDQGLIFTIECDLHSLLLYVNYKHLNSAQCTWLMSAWTLRSLCYTFQKNCDYFIIKIFGYNLVACVKCS